MHERFFLCYWRYRLEDDIFASYGFTYLRTSSKGYLPRFPHPLHKPGSTNFISKKSCDDPKKLQSCNLFGRKINVKRSLVDFFFKTFWKNRIRYLYIVKNDLCLKELEIFFFYFTKIYILFFLLFSRLKKLHR